MSLLISARDRQFDQLRRRLLIVIMGTLLIGGGILGLTLYTIHAMICSFDRLLTGIVQIGRQDEDDESDLLRRVDQALYQAKLEWLTKILSPTTEGRILG